MTIILGPEELEAIWAALEPEIIERPDWLLREMTDEEYQETLAE